MQPAAIPQRAETLQILRLMGDFEPILMLLGDDQGFKHLHGSIPS